MRNLFYFALIALAFQGCRPAADVAKSTNVVEQAVPKARISAEEFIKDAVFQGLTQDSFSVELAQAILDSDDLFVPKCPICTPVKNSFYKYIQAKGGYTGKGTHASLGFSSSAKATKQQGLEKIIQRYVSEHYERLKLSDADRSALASELATKRKTGMSYKSESFGASCPSCDGACKIKKN